jgi:hypothetical protein
MASSPRGEAARQLLASLPEFGSGDKPVSQLSDAYANRLAGAARRQLESGLTPSRQAARGHILTPEHPTSAPPKLPAQPATYRQIGKTSSTEKEAGGTGEAPSAPSQRRTAALTGEPRRPLFHRRPPFQGHIPYGEGGEIYTQRGADEAARVIKYAANLGPTHGERVVMQVYDCSKGRWFAVFRNAGHGQGIAASVLLEMWREHGGSLEAFLMSLINDSGYRDRGRISHICLYEVTILPRDTAAVTALKQRLAGR